MLCAWKFALDTKSLKRKHLLHYQDAIADSCTMQREDEVKLGGLCSG
jgi:hypothetical protein